MIKKKKITTLSKKASLVTSYPNKTVLLVQLNISQQHLYKTSKIYLNQLVSILLLNRKVQIGKSSFNSINSRRV
jgi:hypothetical protein